MNTDADVPTTEVMPELSSASPSAVPFANLSAMQAAYGAFASKIKPGESALAHSGEAVDFVARAVATGARLDACDERQAAPALINVCLSRVPSEAPALGKVGPGILPIR